MAEIPDPRLATSHHELRVRFCETDMMAIVHHANYLVYCEAARVDWLHKRGVSYADWQRMGIQLPVVEVSIRYHKPARFEEVLDVETTLVELTRVSVRFRYFVKRAGALLAEVNTQLACVGPELTVRRIPEDVARVFRSGEATST